MTPSKGKSRECTELQRRIDQSFKNETQEAQTRDTENLDNVEIRARKAMLKARSIQAEIFNLKSSRNFPIEQVKSEGFPANLPLATRQARPKNEQGSRQEIVRQTDSIKDPDFLSLSMTWLADIFDVQNRNKSATHVGTGEEAGHATAANIESF